MPDSSEAPAPARRRPAVFFDRDNTLIEGADYLGDPDKVVLIDGAAACVAGVRRLGYLVVVVSNQSGVARGFYGEADVLKVNDRLDELLRDGDSFAAIDLHAFCPHHPEAEGEYGVECSCRKPKPGMLLSAAEELEIDLSKSWMVGDAPRDIEAGAAAGCRTILLDVPGLARSPAADAEETVTPNRRASSLTEVLAVLKSEHEANVAKAAAERPKPIEPAASVPPTPPVATPAARVAPSDDATNALVAELRRSRETPADDFSVFRLLAGAVQVLALAAFVYAIGFVDESRAVASVLVAVFLQVLTLTLVIASKP